MQTGDTFFDDLKSCLRNDDMSWVDLSRPDGKEKVVQALRFLADVSPCFNQGQACLDTSAPHASPFPFPNPVTTQPLPVAGLLPPFHFKSSTTAPALPPNPRSGAAGHFIFN